MRVSPIRVLYHLSWVPLTLFMMMLCRRKVIKETSPLPKAPVMVICNHMSHYDIVTLALSMYPLKLSFMAKEELFRTWFLRNLFLRLGAFPVNRGEVDRRALRKANDVLKTDWGLAVFPEGTRSPEAKLIPGHPGPALIALRNNAVILPVGLAGTEKIKERKKSFSAFFRRPQVTVHIGEPFHLPRPEGKVTREHLQYCADLLMRHIAELVPEQYQGVYGDQIGDSA